VPSNRMRVEHYIPFLQQEGVQCTLHALLDEKTYRGRTGPLLWGALHGVLRRLIIALRVRQYDSILVHREALPLPTATLERFLGRVARRLVFDFDDAIYLPQPGSRVRRSPRKFAGMVKAADLVLAGNTHLAQRAKTHNPRTQVLPTPVDTDVIFPRSGSKQKGRCVTIGWIGSPSTAHYLGRVQSVIERLLEKYEHVE